MKKKKENPLVYNSRTPGFCNYHVSCIYEMFHRKRVYAKSRDKFWDV